MHTSQASANGRLVIEPASRSLASISCVNDLLLAVICCASG